MMICNDCPHKTGCPGFDCELQRPARKAPTRAIRVNEHNEAVSADGRVIGKVVPYEITRGISTAMSEIQAAGEDFDKAFTKRKAWAHLIAAASVGLNDATIRPRCRVCNAQGVWHCAHPDECGNMLYEFTEFYQQLIALKST